MGTSLNVEQIPEPPDSKPTENIKNWGAMLIPQNTYL